MAITTFRTLASAATLALTLSGLAVQSATHLWQPSPTAGTSTSEKGQCRSDAAYQEIAYTNCAKRGPH